MLTRRSFLATAAPLAAATPLVAQPAKPLPNIVVILADDLGYGDARCYNPESRIETPNIDRLARQGVRFTDAHSPSSVCTPTRYGLMTGTYCWRTRLKRGVLNGLSPSLMEPGQATIGTLARSAGYRTGCFGKWHLGLGRDEKTDYGKELSPAPADFGFDEFFGIPASLDMPPYLWVENRRATERPTSTIGDSGAPPRGAFWRGGPIAPSFKLENVLPELTRRASQFLAHKDDRPFLAYIPLPAPHTPWLPYGPAKGKSRAGEYGDFVTNVDQSLGMLMTALSKSGKTSNTVVIFTSDNGAPWSEPDIAASGGHHANAHLRGQKADAHEGGHRIPFLLRWPGHVKAGTTSSRLTCLIDIYATVRHLTGSPHMIRNIAPDNASLFPDPTKGDPERAIVHHSADGMFAIRYRNWKLIEGLGSGGFSKPARIAAAPDGPHGQLYDLAADPQERHNLWKNRPEVVRSLTARLDTIRARYP